MSYTLHADNSMTIWKLSIETDNEIVEHEIIGLVLNDGDKIGMYHSDGFVKVLVMRQSSHRWEVVYQYDQ